MHLQDFIAPFNSTSSLLTKQTSKQATICHHSSFNLLGKLHFSRCRSNSHALLSSVPSKCRLESNLNFIAFAISARSE